MYNEDYFEMMKEKSVEDKLRAFASAMENRTRASYEGCYGPPGMRDWYQKEYVGQTERVEWLFQELLRVYECKGE